MNVDALQNLSMTDLMLVGTIVALGLLASVYLGLRRQGPIAFVAVGVLAATVVPWLRVRPA